MPGLNDKILINKGSIAAKTASLAAAYEAMLILSVEIKTNPKFQKQAQKDLLPKQEALCKNADMELDRIVTAQWEFVEETRQWLDERLGLNQP